MEYGIAGTVSFLSSPSELEASQPIPAEWPYADLPYNWSSGLGSTGGVDPLYLSNVQIEGEFCSVRHRLLR